MTNLKRTMSLVAVMSALTLSAGTVNAAPDYYVDKDAGGLNNGSSWTNAYTDLQSALAALPSGGEIWVAEGTYEPTSGSDRNVTFRLVNNLSVYGGFAGTETNRDDRDWTAHVTILSGDLNGDDQPNFVNRTDNSSHVVTVGVPNVGGNFDNVVLDGFTVSGGYATTGDSDRSGAGINNSRPALNGGEGPMVRNCILSGNSAGDSGGGMVNVWIGFRMTNCLVTGNRAGDGAGVYFNGLRAPTLTDCVFIGNTATSSGGGAIHSNSCTPTITNCLITGNSASTGSAMWSCCNDPTLINCTITGNIGGVSAIYGVNSCNAAVSNCIFYNNGVPHFGGAANPSINYTCLEGGYAGTGNINATNFPPQFVSGPGGDYYLSQTDSGQGSTSPCVDAGTGSGASLGQRTTRTNQGVDANTVDMGYHYPLVPTGACCLPGDTCEVGVTEDYCDLNSGSWHEGGTCTELFHADPVHYNDPAFARPYYVAVGDLNGDGYPDLAVTNDSSSNVSVTLGNGDGTFDAAANYGVGTSPSSVAIAHLNNDVHLDLAVTNFAGATVSILLGNGDGTFQSAVGYGSTGRPTNVAVADLNGDGYQDLVVAINNHGCPNVLRFLGFGDGTFQAPLGLCYGNLPAFVALGNLDGGDVVDIVVTNEDGSVWVALGNGDGTFQSGVDYGPDGSAGVVAIGDLNGDGWSDLAVANYSALAARVLLNDGDGTFSTGDSFGVGGNPRFVAIGDIDRDDVPDVATANYSSDPSVSILRGNGDGTFQTSVNYTDNSPICLAIADFNDDCRPDLAVTRGGDIVEILMNQTSPCSADMCPAPTGSCCFPSSDCEADTTQVYCEEENSGTWTEGGTCDPNICIVDCNGNGVDDGDEAASGTLYVNASGGPGGGTPGADWDNAYTELQDALCVAAAYPEVTEIWVAAATYRPDLGGQQTPGDRVATFQLISGVSIYGGFAGTESSREERDWTSNVTVLSGDLLGDDYPGDNFGDNSYHVTTGADDAALDGFTITAGYADSGADPYDRGAGMYNASVSPTVANCTFDDNRAIDLGAAMHNSGCSPTITNCIFSNNAINNGDAHGGAMFNVSGGSATLVNCLFTGNTAGGGHGGGIFNIGSSPTLVNCVFTGNLAEGYGGGFGSDFSHPTLTNCTFTGNTANDGGAFYDDGASSSTLTNCIIWGNQPSSSHIWGTPTVTYSCIEDGWGGTGNIDDDPMFVDDYHLGADSPCLNAGLSTAVPQAIASDIDGDDRIQECEVDMGADETPYTTTSVWVGDDGSSFSTATNWDPPAVPRSSVELYNATGGDNRCSITASGETSLCSVTIGPSSPWRQTLQIDGGSALRISSTLNNGSGGRLLVMTASHLVVDGPDVAQTGEIEVRSAGAAVFDYTLTNQGGGKITLFGGTLATPMLSNDLGALLTGFGTVDGDTINDGNMITIADFQVVGDLENTGTIYIQNGILTVTGALVNSGTMFGGFGGRGGDEPTGLRMLGDFDLSIQDWRQIDLTNAVVQMAGDPMNGPQTFEVSSVNRGSRSIRLPDASLFSIGTLRIGPTATTVRLVDRHRNTPNARSAGQESLYVQHLVLDQGATLDLAGLHVYCETVSPKNAIARASGASVIDTVGGGGLALIRKR